MSCESIWDALSAYADGEATSEQARTVETHLHSCKACAEDLAFLKSATAVMGNMPEVEPPAYLRNSILNATIYRPTFGERLLSSVRRTFAPAPLRYGAVGLSGAAAVLLWFTLLSPRTQDSFAPIGMSNTRDIAGQPETGPQATAENTIGNGFVAGSGNGLRPESAPSARRSVVASAPSGLMPTASNSGAPRLTTAAVSSQASFVPITAPSLRNPMIERIPEGSTRLVNADMQTASTLMPEYKTKSDIRTNESPTKEDISLDTSAERVIVAQEPPASEPDRPVLKVAVAANNPDVKTPDAAPKIMTASANGPINIDTKQATSLSELRRSLRQSNANWVPNQRILQNLNDKQIRVDVIRGSF